MAFPLPQESNDSDRPGRSNPSSSSPSGPSTREESSGKFKHSLMWATAIRTDMLMHAPPPPKTEPLCPSSAPAHHPTFFHDQDHGSIPSEPTLRSGSISASSGSSALTAPDYTTRPFTRINNRFYFRDPDNPYPLPCTVAEVHRQSMRTILLEHVFGAPVCAPQLREKLPKRVLEIACGSGLWSARCHDYFARSGRPNVSFTGLDIISIAPDMRKAGIDWHFVRHDLRKLPLPFPAESFDLIFIKDASLCQLASTQQTNLLAEPLRVLKRGGILEIWDSDYVFRALLPNPTCPPNIAEHDRALANATATYPISPATPFAAAQNQYLRDYNAWVEKAFEQRRLNPMPCATIGLEFTTEADSFRSVGSRRIAIPLGEVRWEKEGLGWSTSGRPQRALTEDQLALRRLATTTVVQMIEGMEPILMQASGKTRDEWEQWWAAMTTDLLRKNGAANGECLEVGAWWGQKK
ncbi:hypothetical protein VTN31DRAFT_6095 [Thermomyces dupontii]|uniref:uncharacterized protein n=1 Tax=Talaromyces thermophilus TaxID=28565 RepID=UPI0037423FA3